MNLRKKQNYFRLLIAFVLIFSTQYMFADYCKTSLTKNRSDRYMNYFTLSDGDNEITINNLQSGSYSSQPVYYDKTSLTFSTCAGATIIPSVTWIGGWMHCYVYIDLNNDETFTVELNPNGSVTDTSELRGFTSYSTDSSESTGWHNHLGEITQKNTLPSAMRPFTIPTTLSKGTYRARLIIDWNSLDPCGTSTIGTNGGVMVDFNIEITDDEYEVNVVSNNESWGTVEKIMNEDGSYTCIATPIADYRFVKWVNAQTGADISMQNPYTYIAKKSITLKAIFSDGYTATTDIPTIFINTENGTPITSKEIYLNAKVSVRGSINGEFDITEVEAEVRGRGNSTWGMAKKPYRLKFGSKIKLLGNKANVKNWVLLANYCDKTLMRNALAFETARNMFNFAFTPSVTFVDVVLNDENLGSYMLTDQVEVDNDRVNIEKQTKTITDQDPEITGGYLIEVDGFADSEISWFQTSRNMKVTIKYPKDDDINTYQSAYISNYTQQFEDALFSSTFSNEVTGWRKYFDEASVIDWYIACELFGNSDSWWSTYIYKKRDEKFKVGPLWDFDIAFNNDNRLGDATQKLMSTNAHDPKTWIKRWLEDPILANNIKSRWAELRKNGLNDFMQNYITNSAEYLNQSQRNNFTKWNILNNVVYLELTARGSYSAEVNYLNNYVNNRIDYLDKVFNLPTSIEAEKRELLNWIIAPTPIISGEDINIYLPINEYKNIEITIYSIDGSVRLKEKFAHLTGGKLTIPSVNIKSGNYIIRININNSFIDNQHLIIK